MIEPTVGRKVLYHPHVDDGGDINGQPHSADVVHVISPDRINLIVFNHVGSVYARQNVLLIQDGEEAPAEGGYAEWMLYQKGQAAKAEATESALAPRLVELEKLLATDGAVHTLFADLEKSVEAKFAETGEYLQKRFAEIEKRIGAPAPAPAADAAAGAAPQPAG